MKKPNRRALALLLAVLLLLSALPAAFAEDGAAPEEDAGADDAPRFCKTPFWKEDRSKLPQNVWTDVEDQAYWDGIGSYYKHSGNRADDLLVLARSQLGYRASLLNYRVDDNGEVHNYTRYGAWYGNTYGDWCAMFVSFCLYYAGIPQDVFPYNSNCEEWVRQLRKEGMFAERDEFTPKCGDLVFFGTRYKILHMGIVSSVDEEAGVLTFIQGNDRRMVSEEELELTHSSIIGYGLLPPNPARSAGKPAERVVNAVEQALSSLFGE